MRVSAGHQKHACIETFEAVGILNGQRGLAHAAHALDRHATHRCLGHGGGLFLHQDGIKSIKFVDHLSWLVRRQSVQNFEAPPQKISPDRKSDHDFDELNDQFNSAHGYSRHTLPWSNRDGDRDVRASTCPVRHAGYLNCEGVISLKVRLGRV